jgi:drug/metabolite transporter (DMT)-like permease
MSRPRLHKAELVGVAFALLASTGFGTWTVLTKLAFRHDVGIPLLLVTRFLIGALSLWAVARVLRLPTRPAPGQALKLLLLGVSFVVFTTLISLSVERIPAATSSLLLYTHPAMVATYGLLRGERLRLVGILGLGLSLTGTALVLGAPRGANDVLGVIFGLGSALFLAINVIAIDRITSGLHPFVSSAYIMTGGTIATLAYVVVPGSVDAGISGQGWAIAIALALVSTVVAFTAKVISIERLGATRAAIATTFEPVVSVLLAALILSEQLGALQLLGGALVVTAVGILPLMQRHGAPETHGLYGAATTTDHERAVEPGRRPATAQEVAEE